jgi:ribose transport system permease protein
MISAGNLSLAVLTGSHRWPFAVACAFVLTIALLVGGFSGYVSHHFRVQPLIVTLGVGAVVAGVVVWLTASNVNNEISSPAWLTNFTSPAGQIMGLALPPLIAFWAAISLLLHVVLRLTVFGRQIYFTGANANAARLAHVNTSWVWTSTFALSGAFSALTGMVLVGFSGAGDPGIGIPYLFISLAAVIVGGTSFTGARGSYWHTVLGALIVTVLTTIFVGNGFSSADEQILYGVVVFILAAAYGRDRLVRDRI